MTVRVARGAKQLKDAGSAACSARKATEDAEMRRAPRVTRRASIAWPKYATL
jgi:hypothetical protein